jgi:hypothetical protein
MKTTFRALVATVAAACLAAVSNSTAFAAISYVGSHYDMVNLFPGGTAPYVVSPWRSEINPKPLDIDGNDVYGSDGYALFATQFAWPNPGCCGSSVPVGSATWPNMIDVPSYVAASQFLVTNKVGGWTYALIDDPTLVNGYRDYNWGDTLSPPVSPPNSQSPYVKMGNIEGTDILGNNAKTGPNGAGRWAFTLGADVPQTIRVSVMSDGYDDIVWTATEVMLAKVDSVGTILDIVGSGSLARNRFVDMHLFDIVEGQPGDNYAIFAKATATGLGQGAIAGVAFDSVVPEPTGLTLLMAGAVAVASLPKRNKRH